MESINLFRMIKDAEVEAAKKAEVRASLNVSEAENFYRMLMSEFKEAEFNLKEGCHGIPALDNLNGAKKRLEAFKEVFNNEA